MAARADSRGKIISAAVELFAQYGFWAVRISDIEKAAGTPKGSFAEHFSSKIEALNEALGNYVEALEAVLAELDALLFLPDTWRVDLTAAIRRLLEFFAGHQGLATLAFREEGLREGRFADAIARVKGRLSELVRQKLTPLQRAGVVVPLDLELLAAALYGAVNETIRRVVLPGERPQADSLARALATLVIEGIAAR